MMTNQFLELTGQDPATFSYDLSAYMGLNSTNYPILVTISGWVTTANVLSADVMTFDLNYLDATGNSRRVAFAATGLLIMNDATQFFSSEAIMVRRSDYNTAFTLDGTLVAGTPADGTKYTINVGLMHDSY